MKDGMPDVLYRQQKCDKMEPMTLPILTTKLYIPPLRREIVARPRLIEQLNAGLGESSGGFGHKLTLTTEKVQFGSKLVDGLRVKIPGSAAQRSFDDDARDDEDTPGWEK